MQDGLVKLGGEMLNLRSIESFGSVCAEDGPTMCYVRSVAGGRPREVSDRDLSALREAVAARQALTGIMTLTDISGDRVIVNLSKIEVFEPDQRVLYVAGRPFMLSEEAVNDLLGVLDYTAQAMA